MRRLLLAALASCAAFPAAADPFIATLPVTITGPSVLAPYNPMTHQPIYGPYTATVLNDTRDTLTLDEAVMSLVSPDGAVGTNGTKWTGFFPRPITIAPGQNASYTTGGAWATGPSGDTADIVFWAEYSTYQMRISGRDEGSGANYADFINPALDGSGSGSGFTFCTQCARPPTFLYSPSLGFDVFGGAAEFALKIDPVNPVDEPSSLGLVIVALLGLEFLRRRSPAVARWRDHPYDWLVSPRHRAP